MLHIWGASEAWQAERTSNKSTGLFQAALGHQCYPEGCSDVCEGNRPQEFLPLISPLARGSKLAPQVLLSRLSSGTLQPPVGEQQLPLAQTHHPCPVHPAWDSPRPTTLTEGWVSGSGTCPILLRALIAM